jgi:hypothetical protein
VYINKSRNGSANVYCSHFRQEIVIPTHNLFLFKEKGQKRVIDEREKEEKEKANKFLKVTVSENRCYVQSMNLRLAD